MTTFTLITVTVLLLGAALSCAAIVLGFLLVWTARRIGDVSTIREDLSTLRADHRNLDEIFESYRKRDAQRVSTVVQRAKKETVSEEDPPAPIMTREDIVSLYERKSKNGGH
jgi:hypothetical protein